MLKKTMTYVDFNGKERTEDFYFNLTKAELTELEVSEKGGLEMMINKIVAEEDAKKIVSIFKEFILLCYGVKSDDGRMFIKNKEVRDSFAQTQAYSDLFEELSSDANAASAFINAVVPQPPTPKG